MIRFFENEPLAGHTCFRIGGPARLFARVKTADDIEELATFVQKERLPVFVLGGGSNTLASDDGFNGLVIKSEAKDFSFQDDGLFAFPGASLALCAREAVQRGLSGLEWAYGIPGTVGGAVFGNAGAFDNSIGDILHSVDILDLKTGEQKTILRNAFSSSYRWSCLKNSSVFITHVALRLTPDNPKACAERMAFFLDQKKERQPLGAQCAGSMFQNPLVSSFPRDVSLPLAFLQAGRVSAGYLLESANMKNHVVGRAVVSPKHANFFLNLGGASSADVCSLIESAKERVHKRFGVVLEEEIRYLKN